MNKIEIENRVSLFVSLWCLATVFHSTSFITLSNGISALDIIRILVLCFSLLQIVFPKRYYFFLTSICFSALVVLILPGSVPNHVFFEGVINIGVLLFTFYYLINFHLNNISIYTLSTKIYTTLAPFIRVSVIVLYFFAVLHKLNYDFFDPYLSCSSNFFTKILEDFGLLEINFIDEFHGNNFLLVRNFSIYFAIISEAIIPIALIFNKSRNFGIIYGIFFHIVLALHFHGGIYSFSAMIFVYYCLFYNYNSIQEFLKYFNKSSYKYVIVLCFITLVFLYIIIPSDINSLFYRPTTKLLFLGMLFFLLSSIIYFIMFWRSLNNIKKSDNLNFKMNALTSIMVLFIIFNGMSPYIGLRTEVTFSMFSNLRTEEKLNNHFFISPSIRIFSYQDELIKIESTDIKTFKSFEKDENMRILPFEFHRVITLSDKENEDFYVDFIYKNKKQRIKKFNNEMTGNTLNIYSNLFLLKYLSFRPVFIENKCQH